METKYYTINIYDTNREKAAHQRRKILKKRIKCACGIIGTLAFIYLLGVVGGLEQDMLTIKEAIIHGTIALGLMWTSIEIGGRM